MKPQTDQSQPNQIANAENMVAIGIDWADREHAFHAFDAEGNEWADALEQTPEAPRPSAPFSSATGMRTS